MIPPVNPPAHGFTEVTLTFHITLTPKKFNYLRKESDLKGSCRLVSPYSLVFQAPLVAPSSVNEDVLDLEQVTLQEAPLPPPIQRVMDPGKAGMVFFPSTFFSVFPVIFSLFCFIHLPYFRFLRRVSNGDP